MAINYGKGKNTSNYNLQIFAEQAFQPQSLSTWNWDACLLTFTNWQIQKSARPSMRIYDICDK